MPPLLGDSHPLLAAINLASRPAPILARSAPGAPFEWHHFLFGRSFRPVLVNREAHAYGTHDIVDRLFDLH
jgi:hypothetical protein